MKKENGVSLISLIVVAIVIILALSVAVGVLFFQKWNADEIIMGSEEANAILSSQSSTKTKSKYTKEEIIELIGRCKNYENYSMTGIIESDNVELSSLFSLGDYKRYKDKMYVSMKIADMPIEMFIDKGANKLIIKSSDGQIPTQNLKYSDYLASQGDVDLFDINNNIKRLLKSDVIDYKFEKVKGNQVFIKLKSDDFAAASGSKTASNLKASCEMEYGFDTQTGFPLSGEIILTANGEKINLKFDYQIEYDCVKESEMKLK